LQPFNIDTLLYVNSITKFDIVDILVEYLPVKLTGIGVYGLRTIVEAPDNCLSKI